MTSVGPVEGGDTGIEAGSREDKKLEVIGITILALATVLTAWSGFQATKWSGVQSSSYAVASGQRILANEYFTLGTIDFLGIQSEFNLWLNATFEGEEELAAQYESRLVEEIPEAWDAWLSQDPVNNPDAPRTPLDTDEFRLRTQGEFESASERAESNFQVGQEANANSDDYVLATVFFAVALFFSGISTSLNYRPVRLALLIVAGLSLGFAGIWVATMPIEF